MAFDFPASPVVGSTYTVAGISYVWDGQKWLIKHGGLPPTKTAETHNRLTNPAMQINQEWGVAGIAASSNGYYPVDEWMLNLVLTTAVASATQIEGGSVKGGQRRIRVSITTSGALAAADFLSLRTVIEKQKLFPACWGTADALPVVVRFGVKFPAGQYSASITNSDFGRSFVGTFTISAAEANIDVIKTIAVPASATGVWGTALNGLAAILRINIASGTDKIGAEGWQNAHKYMAAGAMAALTTGQIFELFDVGWHFDPDNTGVAPPFVLPEISEDLACCQRYFWKQIANVAYFQFGIGYCNSTTSMFMPVHFPQKMRVPPTFMPTGVSRFLANAVAVTALSMSGATVNTEGCRIDITTSGQTAGGAGMLQSNNDVQAALSFIARM